MIYRGLTIRTLSELRNPTERSSTKMRAIRMSDELWDRLSMEASRTYTSTGELMRAILEAWLDAGDTGDKGANFPHM